MKDNRIVQPHKRVKPRKQGYTHLSIIAVDLREKIVWKESTGELFPLDQLPAILLIEPDSILAGYEVGLAVKMIADTFENDKTFQVRATPIQREMTPWRPGEERRTVEFGAAFSWLGWRVDANKRASWLVKHYPIDPAMFTASFKAEYRPMRKDLHAVVEWTKQVRKFLEVNNLAFRATQTGIAAQLLRDPRFYPEPRRKVPARTNEKARDHLPGNHYSHHADKRVTYAAVEVDQISSHHMCAAEIKFPHADGLYARGYFREEIDKPFAMSGTRFFAKLISGHGLFYVKVKIRPRGKTGEKFVLPDAEYERLDSDGCKCIYVYSNELDELQSTGVEIRYIIAAWISEERDNGLNDFARWSLDQLAKCDESERKWLKPLLLSTYGLLATKPRKQISAYFRGIGKITHIHIGRGQMMRFIKHESESESEPSFANVIQRGMIEAETRLRSLVMARYLDSLGFKILTVYADAVYCTRERQLPILPAGWIASEISNAHFPDANRVVCDQFVKLPGCAGRTRQRVVDEIRGKYAHAPP